MINKKYIFSSINFIRYGSITVCNYIYMNSGPQSHKFSLSQNDSVQISEKGARINRLTLGGILVIQAKEPYQDLGSGNYLMYPWVNRLQKAQPLYEPVFKDGNGYPIHGLVVNAPMKLTSQNKENKIVITVRPNPLTPKQMPDFTQIFTLQPSKFTVHLKVQGQNELPLCFGYHPYLQFNHEKLSDLTIQTNLKNNIKLDPKILLPIVPFVQQQIKIASTEKYDHLFTHPSNTEAHFSLVSKDGRSVRIASSDMKYWQIYTPPDGQRIAVEPMTFIGNIYSVFNQETFGKLPREGTFVVSVK